MFRWSEIVVGIVFICTIILWITKDLSGIGGWSAIFEKDFVSDGTVAMLCGILPLILPNANPFQSRTIKRKKKYEQENLVFEDDWINQSRQGVKLRQVKKVHDASKELGRIGIKTVSIVKSVILTYVIRESPSPTAQ